ncbi:MAG TPA: long-chain fatty acid--CoA ligase [Spirochaetota bacterium]|nr:long-chain fatty acid--CoA ligase [Spirochaetota bacterium]
MAVYNWNSIAEIFSMRAEQYGSAPCISFKRGSSYEDISWGDLHTLVRNTGYFLLSKGIRKGEKVAIYAPNCFEWVVADMAALSVGAVTVPVYPTNPPEETRYILANSDSKICFAGTAAHLNNLLKIRKRLAKLRDIVLFEGGGDKKEVPSFSDAVDEGIRYGNKALYEKRLAAIKPGDIATVIYTSGTTGDPRGVMLTHENITANIEQINDAFGDVIQEGDIFLSILPLSHAFERTVGYYWPVFAGARIAYAENFSSVARNLLEVRPHCIISVPELYENFHREILSRAEMSGTLKKLFLRWSFDVAAENAPYVCGNRDPEGVFSLKHRIAEALVFSKLREAMGLDRIRCAVSGGGPLSARDAEFFPGIGVPLIEGFGMTETSPVISVNRPGMIQPGTVGTPCRETVIKISEYGEVLVRGPQVMKGYYKNRDATRHAFTKEGYLKTGDMGHVDDEGFLRISGRIKDIIVTSGGKNIAPQNIEYRLRQSPYIESIAVVGDRRKYLSAIIIPSFDQLYTWARKKGIEYFSKKELVTDERVINLISGEIEMLSEDFSRTERVRRFKLIDDMWSQETNELTPTLKIRRQVIEEKYAREIEDMYPVESYLLQ